MTQTIIRAFKRNRPPGLRTEYNITLSCGHWIPFVHFETDPTGQEYHCKDCQRYAGLVCRECGKPAWKLCNIFSTFGFLCGELLCIDCKEHHPHRPLTKRT